MRVGEGRRGAVEASKGSRRRWARKVRSRPGYEWTGNGLQRLPLWGGRGKKGVGNKKISDEAAPDANYQKDGKTNVGWPKDGGAARNGSENQNKT